MEVSEVRPPATDCFPSTVWEVIDQARDRSSSQAREALAALCQSYYAPLYGFIRRRGYDPDEARDRVQGFFASLLEPGSLANVTPSLGRFRAFLLASCRHFLANRRDHDRAQKRGGGRTPIRLGEEAPGLEPSHAETADRQFDRDWALALLRQVHARMKAEVEGKPRARLLEALDFLFDGGLPVETYQQVAARLGMTEAAVKVAAGRLSARYAVVLREEVTRPVKAPADVEDEIRDLFEALGSARR